jgi:PTS system nitrogen regulatory IIA component
MQLLVRDVAGLFDVSERTVLRWIRAGEIPCHEVGAEYRFSRAELLEWATARRLRVPPDLFAEPDGLSLAGALQSGGVHREVAGTDVRTALTAVVGKLPLASDEDRRTVLQTLLAREAAGSTAVGDGIAIPHARSPIVLAAGAATATVCYLAQPVDFTAPDSLPVRTLFTLVSPTVRAHLQLLARLAFALRTPDFREAVSRQVELAELVHAARVADAASKAGSR